MLANCRALFAAIELDRFAVNEALYMDNERQPIATDFGEKLLNRMGHVARLNSDAEHLLNHDRVAGAALMAALAYEELGKLIDFIWKEWGIAPTGYQRNSHDRRQRAVACLMMVADLYPHASKMAGKGGIDENELQTRVEEMVPTQLQRSTFWVIIGGIEKFKHLAMYVDERNETAGLDAHAIEPKHVRSVLDVLEPVLDHLRDPRLLRASALVWASAGLMLNEMKVAGQNYFQDAASLDASVLEK